MANVNLLCGPYRSGRARRIDDALVEHWTKALLIVPTREHATRRSQDIVFRYELPGVLGRNIVTFQDFVAALLRGTAHEQRIIDRLEQRAVLENVVTETNAAGSLDYIQRAASTEGFLHHLERVIAQLKQAAIDPEQFRHQIAAPKSARAVDTVVADIYTQYQDALKSAGVYDLQGMYWIADLVVNEGRPKALEKIGFLYVDGFDDFTPSEFRILTSVSQYMDSVIFGLNYDRAPARRDLHHITAETARQISAAFDVPAADFKEDPPETQCEFASSHLFWRDPPPSSDGLHPDLCFLACHGATDEVEMVGRKIKALLLDGDTSPNEIAVVHRNPSKVAARFGEIFAEFGIPFRSSDRPTLRDSSIGAFLNQTLEAWTNWPREAVVETLQSRWFPLRSNEEAPARALFPILSRIAMIVQGPDQWTTRLAHLRKRLEQGAGEDIREFVRHNPQALWACEVMIDALDSLRSHGEAFPREGRLETYIEAVNGLLDHLETHESEETHNSVSALRAMLGRWWSWARGDQQSLSFDEFIKRFRQALQLTSYDRDAPKNAVTLLHLESIRLLRYDYVFLVEANEGTLPSAPPRNAIYPEEERRRLRNAGVNLDDAQTHGRRELLLFHRLLDVPRKLLTVSWHTASPGGQLRTPSPFVRDLRELAPQAPLEHAETSIDVLVPSDNESACWRDVRNIAFSNAPSLRKRFADRFRVQMAGATVEQQRHKPAAFDEFDGVITAPALIKQLEQEYGANHLFSVNQLETYASCPFRFFMERVLGILDIEAVDEGFDARARGSILHETLQRFHAHYRGKSIPSLDHEEAVAVMNGFADEAFDAIAWKSAGAPESVIEAEKAHLNARLRRYLILERDVKNQNWAPMHFEVAFGSSRGASKDLLSREKPFELDLGGESIKLVGQIDRVDFADGQTRIIDYKNKMYVELKDIREGTSLQLALYPLALADLLPDRECIQAYFIEPGRTKGKREAMGLEDNKFPWEERKKVALEAAKEYVEGIRTGRFHPVHASKSCSFCPQNHVCRHESSRILRKELPWEE